MQEIIETQQAERLFVVQEYGRTALKLSLPEESPTLDDICKSCEFDFDVPDAEFSFGLIPLIRALEVLNAQPNVFRHIGIDASVSSDGYEGKIRLEHLNVYAHYNQHLAVWSYSFFLYWCNDWSGTEYFFDMTCYIRELIGNFDHIVADLAKLEEQG